MLISTRTALLFAAAALMLFGAAGFGFVVMPDLHADLVEIGVRPTVLGGTMVHLYFAGMAMVGFALIAGWAAVESMRGTPPARTPLAVVAVVHMAFGALAFSRSHNPHHLGPIAMGVLIAIAVAIPVGSQRSRKVPHDDR